MSREIKKSELENLVKSMLSEEVKKRKIQKRLDEINAQLEHYDGWKPMYVDDEVEIYPGDMLESGIIPSLDVLNDYTLDDEVNDEYDYLQIGVDYDGRVSGKYYPATLESPAEYPEAEYEIETYYVKNHKTDKWEELTPDHVVSKVPNLDKDFIEKNDESILMSVDQDHEDAKGEAQIDAYLDRQRDRGIYEGKQLNKEDFDFARAEREHADMENFNHGKVLGGKGDDSQIEAKIFWNGSAIPITFYQEDVLVSPEEHDEPWEYLYYGELPDGKTYHISAELFGNPNSHMELSRIISDYIEE